MHSPFSYVAIAALGLSLGYFLTRAPELRHWRVAEMTAIPGLLLGIWRMSPANGLPTAAGGGAIYVLIAVLAFVLAPVISHHLSVGFENFLFRANWTRAGEEIHLRPIRRLIDEDQFHEALRELNELLEKHPATYEAALLKAKLLYHIGGVEETAAALTQLIGQCQTVEQQLGAMDALALVESHLPPATRPPTPGTRRLSLGHELVLYRSTGADRSDYKAIPPGDYEVQETLQQGRLWGKLAREDWGNALICWEAARTQAPPTPSLERSSATAGSRPLASKWPWLAELFGGRRRLEAQLTAKALLKEANTHIRLGEWRQATPMLQKAAVLDPDHYEIAYRFAQAVRQTADDAVTRETVDKILAQSQWTNHERQMLLQLKR